jgi:hypothetical protein
MMRQRRYHEWPFGEGEGWACICCLVESILVHLLDLLWARGVFASHTLIPSKEQQHILYVFTNSVRQGGGDGLI